ncbi:hypothetical protein D3C75_728700 [compost metagenome]
MGRRELGCPPEASVMRLIVLAVQLKSMLKQPGLNLAVAMLTQLLPGLLRHPGADSGHPLRVRLPFFRHLGQQLHQPHPAILPAFGKIRPCKKWRPVRRQQHRQRPPALPGHGLAHRHVHMIHIGPLLPVHLHRNKMRIQQRRHFLILKGLPFHDVAPVTGGIANRQENGFVLLPRLGEGLLRPRKPIHRVMSMLEQIR